MAEFKPIIRGIAHGMKDCLVGMKAVLKLDNTLAEMAKEKRRNKRQKLQRPEAEKDR